MTPYMKKTIILSVVGIAAIGAAIAIYLYNKGPVDVKNSGGLKIEAVELYQAFSKDSSAAKQKYTGTAGSDKILEVSGTVSQMTRNPQQETIVLLKTGVEGASVNCTLEGDAGATKEGDRVVVKGICKGMGESVPEMGILGDVYLSRCYLVK
jgi:hypothetical protein